MTNLKVNSQANCFVLPNNSWNSFEGVAESTTLQPGTYVIRIKEGTFSFWGSGDRKEPFVIIWLHGGLFANLATEVDTSASFASLNGYEDTITIQVKRATKLHALFIDSHKGDNRGEVVLSILDA